MIALFDSGSGGLSVFREIYRLMPEEKFLYYADNAHCPYGEKPKEYIIDRGREISRYCIERGARAIVVACNTATAAAISTLREEFDIPFIGTEPGIKPAAAMTRTGVIGVLATAGTLVAEKYQGTRDRFGKGVRIIERIGKGFVELVENGILDGPEAEKTVADALKPIMDANADVIVLGCTHYPFLSEMISRCAGAQVTLFDPAPAIARRLADVLSIKPSKKAGSPQEADIELISSGDNRSVERIFRLL